MKNKIGASDIYREFADTRPKYKSFYNKMMIGRIVEVVKQKWEDDRHQKFPKLKR
jgi:hypothetical protein